MPTHSFVQVGPALVPRGRIKRVRLDRLEREGIVLVELVDGPPHALGGASAIDLVMRLCPSAVEGRRLRWVRHQWATHNLVGHPGMQVLAWLGHVGLGLRLHDALIPRPVPPRSST